MFFSELVLVLISQRINCWPIGHYLSTAPLRLVKVKWKKPAICVLLCDVFYLEFFYFLFVFQLLDLHKQSVRHVVDSNSPADNIEPLLRCPIMSRLPPSPPNSRLNKSRSDGQPVGQPALSSQLFPRQQPADAFFQNLELPRRLKLFFFWAKTRIFQRMIMVSR